MRKHHDQKQLEEKRVSFKLTVPHRSPLSKQDRVGIQGVILETGAAAEALEEAASWLVQSAFL